MDLLEKHGELEAEYSSGLADDIEAMLQPEYSESDNGSLVQEDPAELFYSSTGEGELELDEYNSSRVRELLEPYSDNLTEEQRRQRFEDRIDEFRNLSLDENTGIEYLQLDPYSVDFRGTDGRVSMSKVDVGYESGQQHRYWIGEQKDGGNFLITKDLLSDSRFFVKTDGAQEMEFYREGGFTGLDVQNFPRLEISNVLELSEQAISGMDSAMGSGEPDYDLQTGVIDEEISRKTDSRQEERIRRRIENTERKSKFASEPENVFEKRMSGDLQPLLQVSDKKKNGGIDLRALFVGPETVPELEEDTYHGVFFGTKKNSGNEQKEFGKEIGDPEKYARDLLEEHGVIDP
jgi:hypothetical protein